MNNLGVRSTLQATFQQATLRGTAYPLRDVACPCVAWHSFVTMCGELVVRVYCDMGELKERRFNLQERDLGL